MPEPSDAEMVKIFESFARISDVWGGTRRGIIISVNGARVGTWSWNKSQMVINPEDREFRRTFRKLKREGILRRIPIKLKDTAGKVIENAGESGLRILPINQATPGILDFALKQLGYLVIDLNLPLAPEA